MSLLWATGSTTFKLLAHTQQLTCEGSLGHSWEIDRPPPCHGPGRAELTGSNQQQLIAHYIPKRLDKHPYRDSPSSSWSQWTPWIFWLLFKIPLQQPLFRKCKPFHSSPDGGPTFNKHLFVSTWSIENRFCGMISWNDSGIWDPDLLTTILWCKGDGGFLLGTWATFHLGYICFGLILPSTLWYLGEVIISCTAIECLLEYPLAKFLIFWKGIFSLVGPALRGFELCSSLEYLVPSNSEGLFEFPRF